MKSLKVVLSVISLFVISSTLKAQSISTLKPEDNFSVKFTGVKDNLFMLSGRNKKHGKQQHFKNK